MIVDSHVHLMPPRLARAIRVFFERHIGDQLVYPNDVRAVLDQHEADGADAVWNLPYAHKPDMAQALNAGMAEVASDHSGHTVRIVTGATVHPGDAAPADTLRRAHEVHGARVLKLHCSVGSYQADDPRLAPVYTTAGELNMPVVVHAGHDVTGLTQQLATFADRLLLGTDAPNTGRTLATQLAWIRNEDLPTAAKDAILGQNANRLLSLP
jgi:predicted TIM-barrel fold metal-dependent hydrolase